MITAILRELTGPEARDVLVVVADDARRSAVCGLLRAAGIEFRGVGRGGYGTSTVRVVAESGGFPDLAGLSPHVAYLLDPIGLETRQEVRYRLARHDGRMFGWGGEKVDALAGRGGA